MRRLLSLTLLLGFILVCPKTFGQTPRSLDAALKQPSEWYGTKEAKRIGETVLLHQRDSGGWHKNQEMTAPLTDAVRAKLLQDKALNDATIDNGATTEQLIYLAKVFRATQDTRFRGAFQKGLDYLLRSQYPNGGFPQFYPNPTGYRKHITFNDNAMVNVLNLLDAVANRTADYGFVEQSVRERCQVAVSKGIDCILNTQVVVNGNKTVWCAQHDSVTLKPAPARTYEKISLSGSESVGIVRFLMKRRNPTAEVREAIEAAIAWFQRSKLTGIRVVQKPDQTLPKGYDRVVIADESAPPLWARFYALETNKPIFCGRDGVIREKLEQIEHERRVGYSWYVDSPAKLLSEDYPRWKRQP